MSCIALHVKYVNRPTVPVSPCTASSLGYRDRRGAAISVAAIATLTDHGWCMRKTFVALLTVAIVAMLSGCSVVRAVHVASGFTSRAVCSETFVSKLDADRTYTERVTPNLGLFRWLTHY